MSADQRIVTQDFGMMVRYEAHATHVCCERIDLIDPLSGPQAVLPATKITYLELMGVSCRELGILDIYPSYPIIPFSQTRDQMSADKPACAGY
jgi:hypothetical protein